MPETARNSKAHRFVHATFGLQSLVIAYAVVWFFLDVSGWPRLGLTLGIAALIFVMAETAWRWRIRSTPK
jgi:hypothetical protein